MNSCVLVASQLTTRATLVKVCRLFVGFESKSAELQRLRRLRVDIGAITHLLPYLTAQVPNTFMLSHGRLILDHKSERRLLHVCST